MAEMETAIDYLIEAREALQKTAREQDMIDGGDGGLVYYFTLQDAKETYTDWGGSGEIPDRNIRFLFNNIN